LCLTWERAVAWDLREMGSAWGRGAREGLSPQEAGKISSQCSRTRKTPLGKSGVMKKDQREQSEQFFLHEMGELNNECNHDCQLDFDIVFCFRRINHMALK
jgi:hypothetical protein